MLLCIIMKQFLYVNFCTDSNSYRPHMHAFVKGVCKKLTTLILCLQKLFNNLNKLLISPFVTGLKSNAGAAFRRNEMEQMEKVFVVASTAIHSPVRSATFYWKQQGMLAESLVTSTVHGFVRTHVCSVFVFEAWLCPVAHMFQVKCTINVHASVRHHIPNTYTNYAQAYIKLLPTMFKNMFVLPISLHIFCRQWNSFVYQLVYASKDSQSFNL